MYMMGSPIRMQKLEQRQLQVLRQEVRTCRLELQVVKSQVEDKVEELQVGQLFRVLCHIQRNQNGRLFHGWLVLWGLQH
jgi:hypothetical protein